MTPLETLPTLSTLEKAPEERGKHVPGKQPSCASLWTVHQERLRRLGRWTRCQPRPSSPRAGRAQPHASCCSDLNHFCPFPSGNPSLLSDCFGTSYGNFHGEYGGRRYGTRYACYTYSQHTFLFSPKPLGAATCDPSPFLTLGPIFHDARPITCLLHAEAQKPFGSQNPTLHGRPEVHPVMVYKNLSLSHTDCFPKTRSDKHSFTLCYIHTKWNLKLPSWTH